MRARKAFRTRVTGTLKISDIKADRKQDDGCKDESDSFHVCFLFIFKSSYYTKIRSFQQFTYLDQAKNRWFYIHLEPLTKKGSQKLTGKFFMNHIFCSILAKKSGNIIFQPRQIFSKTVFCRKTAIPDNHSEWLIFWPK